MRVTSSDYIDCQKIALIIKHQDKKLFRYHGIVVMRTYKDKKSLVKTDGKHGFDLKFINFHSQLSIFYKETARGLPLPLATTSGTLACGGIPSSPLTTQVQSLTGGYLFSPFTTNQDIGYNSLRGHFLLPADHSGPIAMRGPTSSPLLPRIRFNAGGSIPLPPDPRH